MRLLRDPRVLRLGLFSLIAFLFLGWVWGDDWLWAVVRALGATALCIGIVALYGSDGTVARIVRVALGVVLGAVCAAGLGGQATAVPVVAAVAFVVLLGCEYLIAREGRTRSAASGRP